MLEQSILLRAQMILLAFKKLQNIRIAEILCVERHCVGRWRKRWQASVDALLSIEMSEPRACLERAIIDVLRDAHRSGSPGKFSAEQVVQVIATACEKPESCGRPVETWTGRELADELQIRSIVSSISTSRVNQLLRRVGLQPHRRKYWCFTTEKDPKQFQSQVEEVCQIYLNASLAQSQHNTRTVCVDEMTSLQANQRRAPTKRPLPGQIAKIECQYNRHGTLSLTGSWDVVAGQMIQTTIDETRNAKDFAAHIKRTVATDPSSNWIFVADNLNTHYSEPIVRAVAEMLGVDQKTLGKKKRHGVLASMKSRREFLTDHRHKIRFVFTPKHSSWLNQIEVVFGSIAKRVMRHGSFDSKQDLKQKLISFVDYFNKTYAKPMNWTYTGKPTTILKPNRPRTWREYTQPKKLKQLLALVA
jgi:transposase